MQLTVLADWLSNATAVRKYSKLQEVGREKLMVAGKSSPFEMLTCVLCVWVWLLRVSGR
jgi:hypothetical protein